jgi:hypothetical protein
MGSFEDKASSPPRVLDTKKEHKQPVDNFLSSPPPVLDRVHLTYSTIDIESKINENKTPLTPLGQDLNVNKKKGDLKMSDKNNFDKNSFEEFWDIYPKKVGEKLCRAYWKSRELNNCASNIIDNVLYRVEKDVSWNDGYAQNPLNYLKSEGWKDEIQEKTKKVKKNLSTTVFDNLESHFSAEKDQWLVKIFSVFASNYPFFKNSLQDEREVRLKMKLWEAMFAGIHKPLAVDSVFVIIKNYSKNAPTPAEYAEHVRIIQEQNKYIIASKKRAQARLSNKMTAADKEKERGHAIDNLNNLKKILQG